jgi:NAD(P)-dependent dehydrogenase (short-subunit alcohol dehydrogenase family)
MLRLDGESVLVTGAAAGLGRAIVARLIDEGANVTAFDRNGAALEELSDLYGARVATCVGDVRRLADNRAAVELAVKRFGRLDCLIANAGIWDFGTALVDIPEESIDEAFDEVFGVNVKGYVLAVKAAVGELVRSRGSVVMTLSNAAFYTGGGGPLYTAAKHAGVGLVKQLAHELAPFVRVNAVAPGGLASDLRGPAALGLANRSISSLPMEDYAKVGLPLARLPAASEYTGAYVMLASRHDGAAATGSIVQLDSGLGARGLSGVAGGNDLMERFGG